MHFDLLILSCHVFICAVLPSLSLNRVSVDLSFLSQIMIMYLKTIETSLYYLFRAGCLAHNPFQIMMIWADMFPFTIQALQLSCAV